MGDKIRYLEEKIFLQLMKIKKKYTEKEIEFLVQTSNDIIIPIYNWIEEAVNISFFNVINDLLVNSLAEEVEGVVKVKNEDLFLIEEEDFEVLGLPKFYPYEMFVSLKGAGLKDKKSILQYSFQDKTYENGSGNIIFKTTDRQGMLLENDKISYVLDIQKLKIIHAIEEFNTCQNKTEQERLILIAKVQELSSKSTEVFLSKILTDTLLLSPKKCKLKIEKVGEDKFRIAPDFEEVNQEIFEKKFSMLNRVKEEYSYSDGGKKVRVLIHDKTENSGVKTELEKVKKQKFYSKEDINEMVDSPSKFWDTDLLNLDDFGARVAELGIYQPKYHPFISPHKSNWLPGIAIEDTINGIRLVSIDNMEELEVLKNSFESAKKEEVQEIIYKNEVLTTNNLQAVIDIAEKQLKEPEKSVVPQRLKQNKEVKKVLIIKENTEIEEYVEDVKIVKNASYSLNEINNLSKGIQLKKHQREGVAWLQTLSKKPYELPGVLLADDMGLGKTIQVLYFIEWFVQNGNKKPNLVIAPVSLLENWEQEHQKFFSNSSIKIKLLWGNDVKNYIHVNDKDLTIKCLNEPGLYLTTYETLRKQQIPMGMVDWGVVALDEAQRVKTPGTLVTNAAKGLKAKFKIAMTGTPVENSLIDLWCIMDLCNPGLLLDAKSFTKQYVKPLKDVNTNFEELSKGLRDKIGDAFMRRMKYDVAKDLPEITPFTDRIQQQTMPQSQYQVYLEELRSIDELKNIEKQGAAVLQGIMNLKMISDHPYLKTHDLVAMDSDEVINTSAKLMKTIEIVEVIKQKNEKVIVFTNTKKVQKLLRKVFLEKYNLQVAIINGDTPSNTLKSKNPKLSRQQEIDRFQNHIGFNIIVMSPIAAGFGLNITGANHVIHYTRHWNPAKENQATDRAYRIGQTKPVHVYYPMAISPNQEIKTFDIILNDLLVHKSKLASETLFPSEQIEIKNEDFLNAFIKGK